MPFRSLLLRRRIYALAFFWFASSLVLAAFPVDPPAARGASNVLEPSFYAAPVAPPRSAADPDFFGIVGRDPWYDFNTDPAHPNQPNLAFEENMARQLSQMGARWVRIEFKADPSTFEAGGTLNFSKYDSFINEIAPRYGLKVLALVGSDITNGVNPVDLSITYEHINDPADREDGSNSYIRFFANRVKQISDHFGDRIGAFEVLNEANSWYGFKARPENYAALMILCYDQVKPSHPNINIILGATIATGDSHLDHVSYLSEIYASDPLLKFKARLSHVDNAKPFPFDGVAWHPYFPSAWDSLYTVDQALKVMRGSGDYTSKLWVTETGLAGSKSDGNCFTAGTYAEDDEQARYLQIFYSGAAARQSDLAAVFWFKYEDFYVNGQVVPMGLIHLASNQSAYSPAEGRVARFKPAYGIYQRLAGVNVPTNPVDTPSLQYSVSNQSAPYYFRESRHTLSGPFLDYWLKNGGIDLFGLPLTEPYKEADPLTGKTYTVQWFERERFEYHPENAGTKYEVLLGLLGNELLSRTCRSFEKAHPLQSAALPAPAKSPAGPAPAPDRLYFKETSHNLQGGFKTYWEKRGGLAVYGFPTSEEFKETNLSDGKTYIVQYFERARFEYHPENKGTPYEVQLGLLGVQSLEAKAWR